MGLDIQIRTDNGDELFTKSYYSRKNDFSNKHNLSRTFCNFMCRENVVEGEPELDQIARISGADVDFIKQMNSYTDQEDINNQLLFADESCHQEILDAIEIQNKSVENNIDRVLSALSDLINKLSTIDNLAGLLIDNGWDSLDNAVYFSDFQAGEAQSYTCNNFGQDLRNFKRFVECAKEHGAKTVYFSYG